MAKSHRYLAVDFARDRLDVALDSIGHQTDVATTWVWEGVVPYLGAADVAATVQVMGARSAAASCVVVNYQAPSARMRTLLAEHGFAVDSDTDLVTVAGELAAPVRQRGSLRTGRVAVATRAQHGY